ncbi:hypothetical protein VitviT2T_021518 [Vitis vinifera]|uniref:Uncharacterized protein n=1 Tax=Vitis vinifera TaxID=29760 RepID=A0ABY9D787_VITVI|nr:hypothetical protein VitviT2T_021518 [Vitis vinifera]
MEDLAGGSYGAAKTFRSQMGFSQPGAIFAAHFAAAKWGWAAAKWHSCAEGVFRSCETPCEMGLWLRNSRSALRGSSSNGHNFFVSTPNQAPFEAMDS